MQAGTKYLLPPYIVGIDQLVGKCQVIIPKKSPQYLGTVIGSCRSWHTVQLCEPKQIIRLEASLLDLGRQIPVDIGQTCAPYSNLILLFILERQQLGIHYYTVLALVSLSIDTENSLSLLKESTSPFFFFHSGLISACAVGALLPHHALREVESQRDMVHTPAEGPALCPLPRALQRARGPPVHRFLRLLPATVPRAIADEPRDRSAGLVAPDRLYALAVRVVLVLGQAGRLPARRQEIRHADKFGWFLYVTVMRTDWSPHSDY